MVLQDTQQAIATWDKPLNPELYNPNEEDKAFYKKETGTLDDEQLRQHIIAVQAKAYSVHQYPCIRLFDFMRIKLGRLPAYNDLLKLGQERDNALFIDLGCCFGNNARKLAQDNYPIQNIIASDLRKQLWDIGHELFRSTPESFPVPFIEGDILDSSFLEIVQPFTQSSPPTLPAPPPSSVTSLNELRGHVSAIFAGAFFHLFKEDEQEKIARALAGLLSPLPGSMILGVNGAKSEKGLWIPTGSDWSMFCHSPESWKELWEEIFGKGNVEVTALLKPEIGDDDFFGTYPGNKNRYHFMEWSVTRK